MGVNWSRGFFRLWLVVALLWVVPVGIFVTSQAVQDLWPVPVPATIKERVIDQPTKDDSQPLSLRPRSKAEQLALLDRIIEQEDERRRNLTVEQQAAEEEWRNATQRRESLLSNLATWVPRMLALVFLPPLILLLPGLLVAWVGRGFTRNLN